MKALFIVFAVVLCASAALCDERPAPVPVPVPMFDRAVVHKERQGGAFSYSTAITHAYAAGFPTIPYTALPSYIYATPYGYVDGRFYNPYFYHGLIPTVYAEDKTE